MQRLSSNFTLFFKLFVPTGWVSFFGLFAVVIFLVDTTDKPLLGTTEFRIGYLIFFVVFLTLIYFTIFQLKRVEYEDGHIFATDYFKTITFPLENIVRISKMNLGIFTVVWLHLQSKGIFGKRIPFLAKRTNFKTFESNHPQLFKK
ncbi:MAG: hypothetical protein P1U56_07140 [Saprospiraceae bacterium]|nr:hypothetical protein [Saprospiraceae bacterium]